MPNGVTFPPFSFLLSFEIPNCTFSGPEKMKVLKNFYTAKNSGFEALGTLFSSFNAYLSPLDDELGDDGVSSLSRVPHLAVDGLKLLWVCRIVAIMFCKFKVCRGGMILVFITLISLVESSVLFEGILLYSDEIPAKFQSVVLSTVAQRKFEPVLIPLNAGNSEK